MFRLKDKWRSSIVISLLCVCVFAVGQGTTEPVKFDGKRAFSHLLTQVGYGPRVPGSVATQRTREYIEKHLQANGFQVGKQPFTAYSEVLGRSVSGVNLWGTRGTPPLKCVVSAHYDCRPVADRDPDPANRSKPVPGANDGASGVAVLLELASVLQHTSQSYGLVFHDLEDHGSSGSAEGFCQGASRLASDLPTELKFEIGINLDMVGDADLRLPKEGISVRRQADIVNRIWRIGAGLHGQAFVNETAGPVYDDHVPYLQAGYRYINIIDFQYPSWHTIDDTADKCSAESLQIVGDVVFEFLKSL